MTEGGGPRSFCPGAAISALLSVPQRVSLTLLHWALVLGRAPRAPLPDWPATPLAAVGVTIAALIACMFYVDAAAIDWARQLPRWLIDEADEITTFGLSGYFLYPLGFMLLGLAAI
jgi:hypothetical protein